MLINYYKKLVIFIFLSCFVSRYYQNEEGEVEVTNDQLQYIKLKTQVKTTESLVYDVLVNKIYNLDYTLKSLLSDYIYLLIETIICIRNNETDGFQARTMLMMRGGPRFLHNYSSQHFIDGTCDWNVSSDNMALIMKEVEDLYGKIVRLDTDNCPTSPTSVKDK